jgi:hypothetical protein
VWYTPGVKWISLDPGESTGYAVWEGLEPGAPPLEAGTASLRDVVTAIGSDGYVDPLISPTAGDLALLFHGWRLLVVEDWALYPWELENLAWDKCRTARGIGALEYIAWTSGRDITLQPASIKEAAERGGAEEFFMSPREENRHANDAIRHGVYFRTIAGFMGQQTAPKGA